MSMQAYIKYFYLWNCL